MSLVIAALAATVIVAACAVAWVWGGPPEQPFDPAYPVRAVLLVYLVMYGVGAVAIAAAGEARIGPVAIAGGFVGLALGALAGGRLLGRPRALEPAMTVGDLRPVAIGAFAAVGMAGYAWLAIRYGIPLLSDNAPVIRTAYAGVPIDLFRWLVPPAALVAVGVAVVRPSPRTTAAAVAAIAAVVGLEVLAASRALPFELGAAALLVVLWAGRRIGRGTWLLIGVTAIALFVGVLFARAGETRSFRDAADAVAFAANRTVGRVLLIHPRTIEVVAVTFPEEQGFLGGSTYVRWPGALTGAERQESLGTVLFRKLFPDEPPGGFAAPGVLGEAWANGGPMLGAAAMFLVGFLASGLSRLGARLRPTVVDRVFLAVLVVALARTYATSLNGLILTVAATSLWWLACSGRLDRLGLILFGRLRSVGNLGLGRSAAGR